MARNVSSLKHALASTRKPVGDSMGNARALMMNGESRIAMGDSGLKNFVAGLGTDRDKRSYSFYSMAPMLTRPELEAMWQSSWLAKRIVSLLADDSTREWREFAFADFKATKTNKMNPSIDLLEKAEKDLSVQARFNEGEMWGGLYGGAIMLLGMKGVTDLTQPHIPENTKKGDLQYIHILDRWRVSGTGNVLDLTSPMFGKPEFYQLAESSLLVHHSRVIRFDGMPLPYYPWVANSRWGASRLQHVYDALMNADTTTAALASMMFESNVDVITRETLSSDLTTDEGERKLLQRYQLAGLMKSINRILLLDSGEKYEKKSTSFANLDKVLDKFYDFVCGGSDTPRTILFGQSPGGLNSTGDGDARNWYDRVRSWQTNTLGPKLDYFDQTFVRSVLGTFPPDYKSTWRPLWQTSDLEEAQINFQNAQADNLYIQNEVVNAGIVAAAVKARGQYPGMTDEDVDMAEELALAPPEIPPAMPGVDPAQQTGNQNGPALNVQVSGGTPAKTTVKKAAGKKVAAVKKAVK